MLEIDGLHRHDVDAHGTRIHVAEVGEGPLVLFVHGFPESWYSWRHQLVALAADGYRAAAIDVRGYGSSEAPPDVDDYRIVALAGDCVGVVEALGESTATIVGHDWGSPIAAAAARLRPDVFTAVVLLSVTYDPRNGHRPTEVFRAIGGDEEFYIEYFQEPGRAEAEIAEDPARWLEGFYFGASGDAPELAAAWPSSSGPASRAVSTGIAASTATGTTCGPSTAHPSPSRPFSSAASGTAPPCGGRAASRAIRRPCRACTPR